MWGVRTLESSMMKLSRLITQRGWVLSIYFDTLSLKSDKGKGSEVIATNNEVNTKHWSYQTILKF